MGAKELKKELLALIENTDNEELLSLLKEDLVFYGNTTNNDITDQLSSKQLKELEMLATEDDLKDTVTLEEFKKATEKWRSKLQIPFYRKLNEDYINFPNSLILGLPLQK